MSKGFEMERGGLLTHEDLESLNAHVGGEGEIYVL